MHMKNFKLLILFAFITGCGPITDTSYEIVQPKGKNAQMCADNCLLSKTNCQQTCEMKDMSCKAQEDRKAREDYMDYVTVRQNQQLAVVRTESSFRRNYNCGTRVCMNDCMEDHHACHINCGGKVIPHTYCTAFCN